MSGEEESVQEVILWQLRIWQVDEEWNRKQQLLTGTSSVATAKASKEDKFSYFVVAVVAAPFQCQSCQLLGQKHAEHVSLLWLKILGKPLFRTTKTFGNPALSLQIDVAALSGEFKVSVREKGGEDCWINYHSERHLNLERERERERYIVHKSAATFYSNKWL